MELPPDPRRRFLRHLRPLTVLASALVLSACSASRQTGPEATPPDKTAYPARIDAMYADYREDFPGIGEISAEELVALLEA